MMISEAGISIPKASNKSSSNGGFTILEILVVVAIISVIASTIVLNTNFNRPESHLKNHVQQIQKSLKLLLQEAILDDRNFALSIQPKSYLLMEYDGENWVPIKDKVFQALQRPHIFSDELSIDKHLVKIEKTEQPKPHILILSSGEMSVFEWQIEDRNNQYKARLTSTLLGDLTLEGPAESLI